MDELSKTYTLAHSPDGWRVHFSTGIAPRFGLEPYHSLFELIAEDLAILHHQLSDLRAHVEIARREVALAKRVGQGEKGVGRGSIRFLSGNGFLRGVQGARIGERRGVER
jgi:hypothetical protein